MIFAQQPQDLFGLKKGTRSQMLPPRTQRYSETFIWMFAVIQKYIFQIIMAVVGEKLAQLKIIVTSKVFICAQFHMKWITICICLHCHSASTWYRNISSANHMFEFLFYILLIEISRYFNTKFDNEMHGHYHLAEWICPKLYMTCRIEVKLREISNSFYVYSKIK